MKKVNSEYLFWLANCAVMVTCLLLALSLSGCSALFGEGDYQSYSKALVGHAESENTRVTNQSIEISTIAQNSMKYASTPTEALLVSVIATMQIGQLATTSLDIKKPTTGMDVAAGAVSHIPFLASSLSLWKLGEAGIKAAENVTIGENSTVTGSFNDTKATAIGSTATATANGTAEPAEPIIVEPVVVEQPAPVVVEPVIVQ